MQKDTINTSYQTEEV